MARAEWLEQSLHREQAGGQASNQEPAEFLKQRAFEFALGELWLMLGARSPSCVGRRLTTQLAANLPSKSNRPSAVFSTL